MAIALVGNPNSGKTTLFNALTGGKGHIGNWPGVTVEKKEGWLTLGGEKHMLTDLPGIYSLDPDTAEQIVASEYLKREDVGLIINIIDSGNLERSLILTLQLLKLGKPLVLALNMMDELEARGASVDAVRLSGLLGAPVASISATKKRNLEQLQEKMLTAMKSGPMHEASPSCAHCKHCGIGLNESDIGGIVKQVVIESEQKTRTLTDRIDRWALNKWLSIPIFLIVLLGVFWLTFEAAGLLSGVISDFLEGVLSPAVAALLAGWHTPDALIRLISEGIISGVGSVIAFLPQIATLFFLTSLLEDSGYMSRAAFIADRALSRIGLGGGAIMPLIMGFGCSVPAVMACRTLPSEKERRLAMLLVPFFSCSARMPVYALLAGAFFARNQGLVILSVYLIGVVVAVIAGAILNKTLYRGRDSAFVMEIPPYRFPSLKNLLLHAWESVKGFLAKAGTVLLAASVIIWALQYFTPGFTAAADPSDSLLSAIGRFLAPVFSPIGLGDWRASVSFLTGVFAKEAIVSTLGVLTGGAESITATLLQLFTPLQAYVLMVFSLLYIPCASTVVTIKKEVGSWKFTALAVGMGLSVAYVVCLIIYNAGKLLGA